MKTKRIALLAFMVLATQFAANAQYKYEIDGIANGSFKKVFMNDETNYDHHDSVQVIDGKFKFTGETDEPNHVFNISGNYRGISIICDGTPVTVDVSKGIVKGSPLNMRLDAYDIKAKQLNDSIMHYYYKVRRTAHSKDSLLRSQYKLYRPKYDAFLKAYDDFVDSVIKDNTDNTISAIYIARKASKLNYEEMKSILNPAWSQCSNHVLDGLRSSVRAYELKMPGAKFIADYNLRDTTGTTHLLSDYIGKGNYVLVDMWASWCGPCIKEMPFMKAAYDKYHAKGFEIVGVSLDEHEREWKHAVKRLGLKWVNLSDLKGWQSAIQKIYHAPGIPANFLLDGDGRIVAMDLRGDMLESKLAEIY